MLYLTVILLSSALIILFNTIHDPSVNLLLTNALNVIIGVVSIIAIDGIGALIIRRLFTSRLFSPNRKAFLVSKKEHLFYNKLGIKQWKEKVPQLGIFTGFDKGHIKSTSDKDYLYRFLLEANFGVIIHLFNAATGFVIAFIPQCSAPSIWIPIFVINLILSIIPVAILRYNTYVLFRLYERSSRNRERGT